MRNRKNTSYIAGEWVPLRVGLAVAKLRNEIERLEDNNKKLERRLERAYGDLENLNAQYASSFVRRKQEMDAERLKQAENRVNDLGEQSEMWRRLCYDARQERNEAEDQLEDATGRATKDRWVEIEVNPLRDMARVKFTGLHMHPTVYPVWYGQSRTIRVKI